jgi:hypothetical protein
MKHKLSFLTVVCRFSGDIDKNSLHWVICGFSHTQHLKSILADDRIALVLVLDDDLCELNGVACWKLAGLLIAGREYSMFSRMWHLDFKNVSNSAHFG